MFPSLHLRPKLVASLLLALLSLGCGTVHRVACPIPPLPTKVTELPALTEEQKLECIQIAKSITVEFTAPWTVKKIRVLRPNGIPLTVSASYTVAQIKRGTEVEDWPLLAFVCTDTGRIWIGPEYPCYVELSTGLYGLKVPPMFYSVAWYECELVKQSDYKLPLFDDLLQRFQKEAAYFYQLCDRPIFHYYFALLGSDFQTGKITISDAALTNGILKIDLQNSDIPRRQGTMWIDTNTREITRCSRDGQQVYPKIR